MTGRMAAADDQAEAIAFLASGAAFGGDRPNRIDTHAAMIFLAGDRAWKMKRAICFPYLDFSSVDRRRAALEAELQLNRRTAPHLYLGVHSLNRDPDGRLAIDVPGPALDWLLEMRRFPDNALLAAIVQCGGLNDRLAARLADRIAAFHATAEIACDAAGEAALRAVIDGNRESMARYPAILNPADVAALHRRCRDAAAKFGALLDLRARSGRVRHGHGDLHLANIVVLEGEPILFDCLEFDPQLATIDTLYDLAFLLMDLWAEERRHAANAIFNRYLDLSPQDEAGAALMPLFMAVRAAVRAHVHASRAAHADDMAGQRARAYLTLAAALLDPVPARLVAIGGFSGTGKSALARALGGSIGHAPGARILRSDVLRKQLAGRPPEARLPGATYTPEASRQVYAALAAVARSILMNGQSAIVDAVFADRAERDDIEEEARAIPIAFDGVWLDAPLHVRIARIGARRGDASDANAGVALRQAALSPGPLGDWHRLDAGHGRDQTAEAASAWLARRA